MVSFLSEREEEIMRKRAISWALTASMVLSMLSGFIPGQKAYAADSSKKTGKTVVETEIDESTYKALGLSTDIDKSKAAVPYDKDNISTFAEVNEVYVAANGNYRNKYTVRDGFDRIGDFKDRTTKVNSSLGNLYGAYGFYDLGEDNVKVEHGGSGDSNISSNMGNVLKKDSNGFNGLYATSVAFDGGDGKTNYVAELRVHGDKVFSPAGWKSIKTVIDGKAYRGKIDVNIFKIAADGTRYSIATLTPTLNKNSTYSDGLLYFIRRYQQELDAMFEIEKADLNGDGFEDLLVYCGTYEDRNINDQNIRYAIVDVYYGKGNGRFTKGNNISIPGGLASNYESGADGSWCDYGIGRAPVVTLAGGDLEQDGRDEAAVAVSGSVLNYNMAKAGHMTVYTYKDGGLVPIEGLNEVSLGDTDGGKQNYGMYAANCAFGRFKYPGSGAMVTGLIVGGYYSSNSQYVQREYEATQAAYRYVYYDSLTDNYVLSDYHTRSLGTKSKEIVKYHEVKSKEYYRPVNAPLALACADLKGMNGNNENDSVLFGAEVYAFSLEDGGITGSEIGSISICTDQRNQGNDKKKKDQVWIGDVRVGCVDKDAKGNNYRQSFVCVVGVHREKKLNDKDDYYWLDIATFSMDGGSPYSSQEGVVCQSNSRQDMYGTFVSLCLPDIDNDSVRLKYEGEYPVYTNPEVYAILQASPYFDDVQEVYEYVNNGGTSYSTSKGSSNTVSANLSISVGAYVSSEIQLIGAGEVEVELSYGASFEYANTKTTEYEITYNAAGGGSDQVVLYCLKYMYYEYSIYDPIARKWEPVVMPVCLGPSTSIIDVADYDKVARRSKGLNEIYNNILNNTAGDPATYQTLGGKLKYAYQSGGNNNYSSVNASSGADQTQTISVTDENEYSTEVFIEANEKLGAGGGGLGNKVIVGVTSSQHAGLGHTYVSSNGVTYSGTVDNVPADCTGFSFDWQLRVNTAKLNSDSDSVFVIGYDVKNVVRPARMPMGLSVVDTTRNSVSLEWSPSNDADYYEVCIVDAGGNYNSKAVVPYTVTDYEVKGLYSNRTYTFAVRALQANGSKSLFSRPATATTLQDSSNFHITKNPDDTNTFAGGNAEFAANAVYYDGDGVNQSVGYNWQVNTDNGWRSVSTGGSNPTLRLTDVSDEMDGNEYRCRVYYNDITLYTKTATLTVNKADSKVMLLAHNDTENKDLSDGSVVRASGSETTKVENVTKERNLITVTSGVREYILVSDGTNYMWKDSNENYYPCSVSVKKDSDGYVDESQTFKASDVGGAAYGVSESDFIADIDGNTYKLTSVNADDYAGEKVSYASDDVTYDRILAKWVSEDGSKNFYLLGNTSGSEDSTVYYYVADSESGSFTMTSKKTLNVSDTVKVVQTDLKSVYQTKTVRSETTGAEVTYTGDKITLSCQPKSLSGEDVQGDVEFVITGPESKRIAGKYDRANGCYTAQWEPSGQGIYNVYVYFAGNKQYNDSISDSMAIYTSFEGKTNMNLTMQDNVRYGDSVKMSLERVSYDNTGKLQDITDDSEYTVKIKNNKTGKFEDTDKYELANGVFIPKSIGMFQITASNGGDKTQKNINVGRTQLEIAAQDTEKSVNDSVRECEDAVITGLKAWDTDIMPQRDRDYELGSYGVSGLLPGIYDIDVAYVKVGDQHSQVMNELEKNYIINLVKASYTLTGNVYTVTARPANTHGTVSIKYQQPGNENSDGLTVDSGTRLPENSTITLAATPHKGYKVKSWSLNGKTVTDPQCGTSGGKACSDDQIQMDKLKANMNVAVNFEPVYHKLTYKPDNEAHGTLKANYVTDGTIGKSFGSGANIHIEQKVRLTAVPAAGYVLDHWTVTGEDGVPETVLAEDGVTNNTSLTYDAEEISEDTLITAYFAEAQNFKISVAPVTVGSDGKTTVTTGVDVTVKAQRVDGTVIIESGEDGIYEVSRGDNVTIQVTVPSGLLLDGWSAADGQELGTVSADLRTMTVYDIASDLDYTVKYTAPNRYKVTYGADDDAAGVVDAVAAGSADALVSGDKQLQGSDIVFTATPNEGYEIAYWEVNGEKVDAEAEGADAQRYELEYLGKDTKVVVYFYKQPVVSWTSGNDTEMTAKSGDSDLANGGCIAYASKDDLKFTFAVKRNYEIADIKVNYAGEDVFSLAENSGEGKLAETADAESGTERYTFTWSAPADGFTGDVTVNVTYRKITPSVKAEYSLKVIEKASAGEASGKTHGSISADVSRKNLPSYIQIGDTISDATESKSAQITDIYRDSVITFKVVPDDGYNVKEWIINGHKLTSETENIKLYSDKKVNDTLKITVDGDSSDVTVMAGLELVGDVLTFGPETEGTGEVSAMITSTKLVLESGDMIGAASYVEFTAAAAEGYEVADWLVNGISQGVAEETFAYKVPKDTRVDVRAVFDRPVYKITWSADGAGQIEAENVTSGETLDGESADIRGDRMLKFMAIPDQYMECTGFTVKTAEGTKDYTAEELGSNVFVVDKVASDIDVVAHFAKQELKSVITFEANDAALGTVTAVYGLDEKAEITSGDSQVSGGDAVFTAAPADGQMIEGWYLDPECTQAIEGTELEQTTYEVKTIYTDVAVYVKFVEIPEYTVKVGTTGTGSAKITASSDGEELEIVSGEVKLKRHKDLTITVTPKDEYNTVEHWTVDGVDVDSDELTYKLTDITKDAEIYAYIAPSLLVNVIFKNEDEVKKYDNIDISTGYAGEDGDISGLKPINAENNLVRIGSGKDVRFAITPSDDYMIQAWTVKYIRGGKVVKEESGADFGFTNEILLNDVTNSIEVSAELVDRVGYAIPVEGNYDRDNNLIETAGGESTPETAYTITDLTKIPDNVVFKNDNGVVLDNMVRENGDASVVITPAEGWRIRDIIIDEPENAENSEESENIMSVQPVLAEDGTETGAYLVSDVNVTKNMEFKVDAVKLYSVTIADTEHGNIKVTKPDGTEVENGEMIDEKTVLTYTATPDMYYDFDAWTEDAADQAESTFEKALDGSITVGAAFKARYAKVSIATVKNGTVTVTTADGKKISNGQLVQEGTDIICKAIPAKHCDLSAWGGDAKGKTGTTVKLTVTKNMNISAAFKFRYVKVAIGKTENGSITIKTAEGKTVKNGASVIEGTVLICTAKAAKNCKLGSWTGSFKSTKTSVKVAANKNMKINARFVAKIPAQNTAGINKNIHAVVSGNKVTVVWGKVNRADGYDIYAQKCYVNFDSKSLIKSVKGASATRVTISGINGKSLAKLDMIKLRVKAYKLVNGKKKYIDNSVMLHIVTNSSKYTNIKKVLLPRKSYVLGVKQTIQLKPGFTKADASKMVLDGTHGARYLYACTNKNVATVDAKGRIKAKAAGKCTVYVIAVNGTTQAVQIIVK
jgi:hypothetical protein